MVRGSSINRLSFIWVKWLCVIEVMKIIWVVGYNYVG
jgi:hypothetical protein